MGQLLTTRDEESKSYIAESIHKYLDSGYLKFHYRTNGAFIVREKVLYGFKHEFLDAVDVFTASGRFIGKVYRIRENRYSGTASEEIVRKILNEYLYSSKNREMITLHLAQLYHVNGHTERHQAFVNNFISEHEH